MQKVKLIYRYTPFNEDGGMYEDYNFDETTYVTGVSVSGEFNFSKPNLEMFVRFIDEDGQDRRELMTFKKLWENDDVDAQGTYSYHFDVPTKLIGVTLEAKYEENSVWMHADIYAEYPSTPPQKNRAIEVLESALFDIDALREKVSMAIEEIKAM